MGCAASAPACPRRCWPERVKAPFRDWADLMARVKGIGAGNAARFSAQGLTVNGQAYVRPAAASAAASTPAP